jgi:hypothetical protein
MAKKRKKKVKRHSTRKYPVYPVGIELRTKRYNYKVLEVVYVKNYIYAYKLENLTTGKTYDVAYRSVHSSRYKLATPAAEVLYG